jgi:excinuclease ABC subunit C
MSPLKPMASVDLQAEFDREKLKQLPNLPGVYQMLGCHGEVLYVGKAKHLKRRVSQYFQTQNKSSKNHQLVSKITEIEVIITPSELEALLLECNLIKKHRPKYNVLLRDDKSYPFLTISAHEFPRLAVHRGAQAKQGEYFGPYPHAKSVRAVLNLMQRLFKVRPCRDHYFKSRSRPCLQFQINRCTAPCVNAISASDYAKSINHVKLFLAGKSQAIITELIADMQQKSDAQAFEQAAELRDLIAQLRDIQAEQNVTHSGGDIDVLVLARELNLVCVQVLYIRAGRITGSKSFFPKAPEFMPDSAVLQGFMEQYYLATDTKVPPEIITPVALDEVTLLTEVLSAQRQRVVKIYTNPRGKRRQWVLMAGENAVNNLRHHAEKTYQLYQRFAALVASFDLSEMPNRIECFDVSHSHGEATQAACVAFNLEGPQKRFYRRYNISNVTAGDDYAAMQQALQRHFKRLLNQNVPLPDVLIVDGGKGQMQQARKVLTEYGVDSVLLVGIAKGAGRHALNDKVLLSECAQAIDLDAMSLHLIQALRDEAHRFAITGHRKVRDKRRVTSVLEGIDGIGTQRRSLLLKAFGGLQGLKRACLADLEKVKGISSALARRIYDALRE